MENENIRHKQILDELKKIEQQVDINNRIKRLQSFLTLFILFALIGILFAMIYFIDNYSRWWRYS